MANTTRTKLAIILSSALVALIEGGMAQYFDPGKPLGNIHLISMFIGLLLIYWWYCIDAEQRAYTRSKGLNTAVIFISIIGLAYYFFKTRGAFRGSIATILFLLLTMAWSLISWLGAIGVYFTLQS